MICCVVALFQSSFGQLRRATRNSRNPSSKGDGCGCGLRHLEFRFCGAWLVAFASIGCIKSLYSCGPARVSISAAEPLWKATADDLLSDQYRYPGSTEIAYSSSTRTSIP